MQRVIVTVKRYDETQARDLEVPAEVEANRLAELIARALRWETGWSGKPLRYQIEAQPLGRFLLPNETLASARVWDGSWLILHAEGSTQLAGIPRMPEPDQLPTLRAPTATPVSGWRSLGIDLPDSSNQMPSEEQHSGVSPWKKLE